MSAQTVIEARGLTRRFADLVAVDAVDLSIERGEIFGCLGPNGSGKSTLMRMLLGLLEPSAGGATVLGHEIPRDSEHLRPHVGYMTQRFSLYEELSVRENLEFCAEIFGLTPRPRRARVESVLEESGLEAYRDVRAAALSGGWKQRLALAASTIHSPELLVLDEPTAGVDPQSRREFWARLFEIAAAGATIFVSTHYMDEAVRCHRLCMLSSGRRVAVGTPLDLIRALGDRVVELRLPDAERALRVLAASPLVASTTQLGDSVHVLLAADAPPAARAAHEIAEFVAAAGLADARAGAGSANLEDVFVALMAGEQIGGAPTNGGRVP